MMKEKELQAKIACEIALHLLRKAVKDGVISAIEFERAAKGMVNDTL